MSEKFVKLVGFVKRKQGMSFEEFQQYYENNHAKLVTLVPRVQRAFRRYLQPLVGQLPHMGKQHGEQDFDAITELWFKNREDLEFAFSRFAEPSIAKIFADDEENLFDRSSARTFVIEDERYSDLTVDLPAAG